ncbi:FAD-dependent oxidoreductase [Mycoplasma sp. CSL10166]|nr:MULTISPECIES: FAD-dependent oxidoreductase [unclassified Mycoplasma]MBN4084051.1 FAD-dependent oxidoreductase [Mycoplasma sp. CSL10166]MBU4693253.1 FAD-dependent oxidoreductase [Mycoplasma sp. CSL7491-lung]
MMQNKIYDLVIIGGGPAGLNAAIYASRANLSVIFIEKGAPGGKLSTTSKVENWIGTENIEGWQLALNFFNHSKKYGAVYKYGKVVELKHNEKFDNEVRLENGDVIYGKTVLISTGMKNVEPNFIENFQSFLNRGASFCAICDGPLFKGLPSLVLGNGNSAIEEASYLSTIASKVYVVIKDEEFKAEQRLVNDLLEKENVIIFKNSRILSLKGDGTLENAIIEHKDGTTSTIQVASFFPYIGMEPSTDFVKNKEILDDKGFVVTNKFMETSLPGVFAAGDIRAKEIRQIVTAASDGAIAARRVSDLLLSEK